MENTQVLNHHIANIADGILLIWWGTVIVVDPLTIGMGAIGTGLILLGVNALRLLRGIPTKPSTTALGLVALIWGALDHTLSLGLWPSFAILLIVIGLVQIGFSLASPKNAS